MLLSFLPDLKKSLAVTFDNFPASGRALIHQYKSQISQEHQIRAVLSVAGFLMWRSQQELCHPGPWRAFKNIARLPNV